MAQMANVEPDCSSLVPENVSLQIAAAGASSPSLAKFWQWALTALPPELREQALTLRVVDEAEMVQLNGEYRGKPKTTNVLSFPAERPDGLPDAVWQQCAELGDLIFCAAVVEREAAEQGKTAEAHWAHLTIHGVLHLRGFDHIEDAEAELMEAEEVRLLNQLGYSNPYL